MSGWLLNALSQSDQRLISVQTRVENIYELIIVRPMKGVKYQFL
jgi:hypothetical protein